MNPIPTSGIAIFVVSVTIRTPGVRADADAPAHHDAVHQRDIGLGVAGDLRVEQILVVPEPAGLDAVGAGAVIDRDHIAAGAQAALTGAGEDDRADLVVVLPFGEHRRQRGDHGVGQRVDGLGPVEGYQADALVNAGQDLVGVGRQAWLLRGRCGNYYDILVLSVEAR